MHNTPQSPHKHKAQVTGLARLVRTAASSAFRSGPGPASSRGCEDPGQVSRRAGPGEGLCPGQAGPGPGAGRPLPLASGSCAHGPCSGCPGKLTVECKALPRSSRSEMSLLAPLLHPQTPTPVAAWSSLRAHSCSLGLHGPRPCTRFSHPPSKATEPFSSSVCLHPAHPDANLEKMPSSLRPQAPLTRWVLLWV